MNRGPSISFIICILMLTLILIVATLIPDKPIRFIVAAICYILWFIAGFLQGVGSKYWNK